MNVALRKVTVHGTMKKVSALIATISLVMIPAAASAAPSSSVYCEIQNVPSRAVDGQAISPMVNVVNNSGSEITTDVTVTLSLISSTGSKGGSDVSHIVLPAGYNFDYPVGTLYAASGSRVKIVAKSTSGPRFHCNAMIAKVQ